MRHLAVIAAAGIIVGTLTYFVARVYDDWRHDRRTPPTSPEEAP